MARIVEDREDLLRDARGLAPRLQLRFDLQGQDTALFAGFRGEALSLYFGSDPVFHFNAAGELRRGYCRGTLIKADGGKLLAMDRVRTPQQIELRTHDIPPADEHALLDDLSKRLRGLRAAIAGGAVVIEGEEPAGAGALERLRAWLVAHADGATSLAASPRVGGVSKK
ncbi:MAG TPA: hypothetical protein VEQ85_16605 [Lacipirellulaceae bacterium]|nr:hypothetical protein [Lacipirellulaceae bacterium]